MTTDVDMTFSDLGLPDSILQALEKVGYEKPSPIQAESIPLPWRGTIYWSNSNRYRENCSICIADARSTRHRRKVTAVIGVGANRELAIQVAEAFQVYASFSNKIRVLPIYGGVLRQPNSSIKARRSRSGWYAGPDYRSH